MNPFFVLLHNAPQCIYLFIYLFYLFTNYVFTRNRVLQTALREAFSFCVTTDKCRRKLWSTQMVECLKKIGQMLYFNSQHLIY